MCTCACLFFLPHAELFYNHHDEEEMFGRGSSCSLIILDGSDLMLTVFLLISG